MESAGDGYDRNWISTINYLITYCSSSTSYYSLNNKNHLIGGKPFWIAAEKLAFYLFKLYKSYSIIAITFFVE